MRIALISIAALFGFADNSNAEAFNYRCQFASYCDPEIGCTTTNFLFEISWDTLTDAAFIKGNNGVSPLIAVRGLEAVTFLEILESGGVHSTTIVQDGKAAHSRNTIFNISYLDYAPSQYYGGCKRQ